jgi:hypothetical protein
MSSVRNVELSKLNLIDLRKIAKERECKGYSGLKKEEIINMILEKEKSNLKEEKSNLKEEKDNKETESKMSSSGKCSYIVNKGKDNERICGVKTSSNFCKKHTTENTTSSSTSQQPVEKVTKEPVKQETNESNNCKKILKTKKQCGNKASVNGFCKKHADEEKISSNTNEKTVSKTTKETSKTVKQKNEEKDTELINNLVVKRNGTKPTVRLIRNQFNNWEHAELGLIYNTNSQVIGRQNPNGSVDSLTLQDIQLCREYNFNYIIPDKITSLEEKEEEIEEEIEEKEEDIEEEEEEEED